MSEEKKRFETWEEVIVNFFEHKISDSEMYKAREYIEKKDNEISSERDEKKLEKLKNRRKEKVDKLAELRKTSPLGEIRAWIDKTSEKNIARGKRIVKATHVLRFTHSSSSSEGYLLTKKSDDLLLTTASLKKDYVYDLAHNNGNLISVSRFLSLSLSGTMIIDCLIEGNYHFLDVFYENEEQLKKWKNGLSNLVEQREIKTADKAKQLYFPIQIKQNDVWIYHLLVPLFSSSLAEEMYLRQFNIKFGQENKLPKQAKKGVLNDNGARISHYHPEVITRFPRLAAQKFGGDNPQNVSMSNVERRGKNYLLSTQAPTWKSQLKPPIYKSSFFDAIPWNMALKENIDYLRDFLLRFDRLGLSFKDPKKMEWIKRWVEQIIDEVFAYCASVQNLPSKWSSTEDIKLKIEHRYLLDPFRDDVDFQEARNSREWQTVVCKDFANWLNGRLKGRDRQFTPQPEHTRLWKELMEEQLREFDESTVMEIKSRKGETV